MTLDDYWNSLDSHERKKLLQAAGLEKNILYFYRSNRRKGGMEMFNKLNKADPNITLDMFRPDLDWDHLYSRERELLEKWTEYYADGMDPDDVNDLYTDTLQLLG